MLRLVVVLVSVVAISAFSLPSLPRRRAAVGGTDRPCIAAASAVKALLDNEAKGSPSISVKDIVQFASGVDPDDSAQVQEVVCLFIEETTESFIESMRQKGIEYTLVRGLRAYVVASIEIAYSQYVEPGTPVHSFLTLVLQTEFAGLDTESMAEMDEILESFGLHRPTVKVPERLNPVTCEDIQNSLLALQPYWQYYQPPQLSDKAFLQLACSVLLSQSIDDLVQVVDAAGLPTMAVDYGKTVVRQLGNEIPYIESQLKESESWGTADWVKKYQEKQRIRLQVLYALRDAGMIN